MTAQKIKEINMSQILIGKTLIGIKLSEDKTAILFCTDEGEIKAQCDADCCSFTWIEHIEMPALGLPAKIISAGDLDMPDLGDMADCDVVDYYGFKITTNKGEIVIDYRNDSNGYYGGSLSWPGDYFYGGVFNQNVSKEVWKDVTDDM